MTRVTILSEVLDLFGPPFVVALNSWGPLQRFVPRIQDAREWKPSFHAAEAELRG
jgi:hypothetical protein